MNKKYYLVRYFQDPERAQNWLNEQNENFEFEIVGYAVSSLFESENSSEDSGVWITLKLIKERKLATL